MGIDNWEKVRLGDICEVIGGYAFKSKDFTDSGIPVIKIKNIQPPIIDIKDVEYVGEEFLELKKQFCLSYNDILISLTGSSLNQINSLVGKIGRVKVFQPLLLNQRVGKFNIKDETIINKNFLYYTVSMKDFQYNLALGSTGSANQANISPKQIEDVIINLPPLETQEKIANILSSLDDKIENNKRTAEKLEEIAQTLFNRWFVEFNFPNENGKPYKDNGGEMVESELGLIPVTFKVSNLGDVFDNMREKVGNEEVPVLSAVSTGELLYSEEHFEKRVFSKEISKYLVVEKNNFAYNPSRINIGSLGENLTGKKCCVSPIYIVISCNKSYNVFFRFFFKSNRFKKEVLTRASGSVRQTLNFKEFSKIQVVYPCENTIIQYNYIYSDIYNNLIFIENEIQQLKTLRDTLLPKLMSGEMEV